MGKRITAKVRCGSRVNVSENNDHVAFHAHYQDGANPEWAYLTPSLYISMNVRPEVSFTPGENYTLTFELEGED